MANRAMRPKTAETHRKQLEELQTHPGPIFTVGFGDSYLAQLGWNEKLATTAALTREAGMKFFAVGGDRVKYLESRLQVDVLDRDKHPFPDVKSAFVLIGLNDVRITKTEKIVDDIRRVMSLLNERFPRVILLTLPPAPIATTEIAALNARLESEFEAVSAWSGIGPGQFESDLTHLNPDGYKIFISNLLSILQ